MLRSILRWLNAPLHKPVSTTESLVDPTFGVYRYSSTTKSWSTHWQSPESAGVMITCRSERPTAKQAALWHEAQERLPQLVHDANASIPEPPVENYTPASIPREGNALSEIRFEDDDTVHLFLDFMITDPQGYQLYPEVVFKDWHIISSERTLVPSTLTGELLLDSKQAASPPSSLR